MVVCDFIVIRSLITCRVIESVVFSVRFFINIIHQCFFRDFAFINSVITYQENKPGEKYNFFYFLARCPGEQNHR